MYATSFERLYTSVAPSSGQTTPNNLGSGSTINQTLSRSLRNLLSIPPADHHLQNQDLTSEDRWLFPWCVRIILLHSVKHNPAVASNEAAGRMNRVLGSSSSTGLDEQEHIRLRPANASRVQEAD